MTRSLLRNKTNNWRLFGGVSVIWVGWSEEACFRQVVETVLNGTAFTNIAVFSRKRSSRKPIPEHLPRERVGVPGPWTAPAAAGRGCSSWAKLAKVPAAQAAGMPDEGGRACAMLVSEKIGQHHRSTVRRNVKACRSAQPLDTGRGACCTVLAPL